MRSPRTPDAFSIWRIFINLMAMWGSDSRPQSSDLTCKREMGKVKYIYQQQEKRLL